MYYEIEKVLRKLGRDNPDRYRFNMEVAHKFQYLDEGTYRKVYATYDDYGSPIIFKILKDPGMVSSNYFEWRMSEQIKKDFPFMSSFALLPLEFFNVGANDVIIFPKVQVRIGRTVTELLENRSHKFKATYEFIDYAFHDAAPDNIGIVNDLPVIIDYAPGFVNHRTKTFEEKSKAILAIP